MSLVSCQLVNGVSHIERQIKGILKVRLDRLMLIRVLMQLLIYRIFKATNARSNLLLETEKGDGRMQSNMRGMLNKNKRERLKARKAIT